MAKLKNILVVGASVAGPAVCYWLNKCGFSPTLIEKSQELRKGGFAVDIRGVAVDVAKKMGIYEQVLERRTQLECGRYVDAQGNTIFEERGEAFGFRQGEEVEIVRGDLVDVLMSKIKDIPCHFNCSINSIVQHNDGVEVIFKDGRCEHYDLVIGADGLHSSTRQQVFGANEYHLINLGSYLCVFNVPNFLNLNYSEILFEANQKLVQISSDRDPSIARAGFMFRSNHQLTNIRDEKEQRAFLKDTYYDLGWETNTFLALMECCDDFYFDSITQVKMDTWSKGRVVLLGDAGYCASPLSGQGTSLALVGAYLLAGELNKSHGEYEQAFKRYNSLLKPFVVANQHFGAWVSETFLLTGGLSENKAKERASNILENMSLASHAIKLPDYCFQSKTP